MFRLIIAASLGVCVYAQVATVPADVEYRKANIISAGTRMSAEVFSPKAAAGKKLPSIVMAHGWGGTAALLRRDAVAFAQNGYLVVTFDYRGWGAQRFAPDSY